MKKAILPVLLASASFALTHNAVAQANVYVEWPLTANANAVVRIPGVTAGAATFKHFVLSNGAVPPGTPAPTAYPAYSANGQAFGVQADGGGWSANATPPGPGGSPRRGNYEQFRVTAAAASRADSVIFDCVVPASVNGRVAVTYSLSNYTTDSASVSGGLGPGNVPLPAANNATFGVNPTTGTAGAIANNPALIPQFATPRPPSTFRLALNGANGVAIPAGGSLTVHIGAGVASGSAGRYVILRNVVIRGRGPLATRNGVNTNLAVYPNPAQNQVVVPHTALGQDARITVYNTVGTQVASAVAKAGSSQTTVSLQSLAAGLYLVEYANGTERSSARVVKE